MTEESDQKKDSIPFSALLLSVLSAFFGVQSSANRKRDFTSGKLSHFIIIGLMLGLVFILAVVGVVNLVMNMAGA